jgi:hypothetical protein
MHWPSHNRRKCRDGHKTGCLGAAAHQVLWCWGRRVLLTLQQQACWHRHLIPPACHHPCCPLHPHQTPCCCLQVQLQQQSSPPLACLGLTPVLRRSQQAPWLVLRCHWLWIRAWMLQGHCWISDQPWSMILGRREPHECASQMMTLLYPPSPVLQQMLGCHSILQGLQAGTGPVLRL